MKDFEVAKDFGAAKDLTAKDFEVAKDFAVAKDVEELKSKLKDLELKLNEVSQSFSWNKISMSANLVLEIISL